MNKHIPTALLATIGLLFLASASALAQNTGGAEGPQPKMFIEYPAFDLGDIVPGQTVQHEFILKNQGQTNLELLEMRPACGCAVTSYDKTIAPGAEGRVLMKLRVYQEWAGQDISKSVWLITNDPETPQTTLTLSGRILPNGAEGNTPPPAAR